MSEKARDDKRAKPAGAKGVEATGAGKKGTEPSGDKGAKKTPSRARRLGIAVLAVVVLLGISFLGGWLKGRGAMTEWRERAQTSARLATLYEARHRLDEAWHAIDRDDFGEARTQVGEAAKVLGRGPEDAELRELAEELAEVQIVVSDEPGTQQQKLKEYMKRLDALASKGTEEAEGS
ncbi:MAG: hypothetical protein ACOCUS_04660 [Polyangiales bacterium]